MIINTNISSLTAQEASKNTNNTLSSSLEKLSSGLKINKASDDASGLAIADKLRTQVTSINQGVANGNSAVTLLQIADKSMSEQSSILDTVKAKLIQANTDTTSADGRESIRKDIAKLLTQLDNIATQTNYNGNVLLQASRSSDGTSAGLSFQVGEKDSDLITNTAIQSNTAGLAGKVVTTAVATAVTVPASGAERADTLAEGDTQIIKQGDAATAITLTGSGTKVSSISVGGKVGEISAVGALTISNLSSSDLEKLSELAAIDLAASTGDLTNNNDGTFTLKAGAKLELGDFTVNSMKLTGTPAEEFSLIANTANDKFTVQNIGEGNLVIAGGHADSTIGLDLGSLKILGTGELTKEAADIFQGVIDTSITNLNAYRGDIGSTQNQVESAVRNLMTQSTNLSAAESIIRDVDYAEESANFNKQNIISQAGSYAISQANTVQQNVLKLLQ